MARDNNITIIGNLTRDPELRFTQGGAAVTDIGVAWNESRRNKETQQWEDVPSYFDITCWFDLAENVAATLRKGDRVVVTGNLKWESWQTADGESRNKVKVIADDVAPSLVGQPLKTAPFRELKVEAVAVVMMQDPQRQRLAPHPPTIRTKNHFR